MPSRTRDLPHSGAAVRILGVEYAHSVTAAGGDLYLTAFGVPFAPHLRPENWLERDWFERNRVRLEGSSTVYRVRTRPVDGRSLDIVVKWCRVGEAVPFDTMTLDRFAQAEFNSPYEEFARVMELRADPSPGQILTHKPLAIYVPPEMLEPWQTGRSQSRMELKKARHRDVELDISRQYILIYEWIKGFSVVEALERAALSATERDALMAELTHRATADLAAKGFRVLDMKPAHVIVRTRDDGTLLRDATGHVPYALIDFELLERTPERARAHIQARRRAYLQRLRDRFAHVPSVEFPPHLRRTRVLGIPYVFGHSESTHGWLWTAGEDPGLFDYFLPERWRRTRKVSLSKVREVYWTLTKDYVNIVWKVSEVGERPDPPAEHPGAARIVAHGYNSPFEEFAIALELPRRGVRAVYPRAIYMTGLGVQTPDYVQDPSRYESHANLRTPDGLPVLSAEHNYITIWGFWNGADEMLAAGAPAYCQGIDLELARQSGYVSRAEHDELLDLQAGRLRAAGMEDLDLQGRHVLLSLNNEGVLIRDPDGTPEMLQCNFELIACSDPPWGRREGRSAG